MTNAQNSPDPSRLDGKVAIVTGGSRGIGQAIAHKLAARGAKLVVTSRKPEAIEAAAAALREQGAEAEAIACHGGDVSAIEAMVQQAVQKFGQVDVLVNNAATNPYFGPMMGVEWPAWEKTFEVNVRGYFATAKAVAQHLMDRGAPGSIINVSSVLGTMGGPLQGVYAMTKAAVISMSQTLAIELGHAKIRVNAIAPGFIDTRFSAALTGSESISKGIVAHTPLGRIGEPDDVSGLVAFLASEESRFITGATLVADGGMTTGMMIS